MTSSFHLDTRPEAMADVPGVCELPLTRAIVQYRDVHEAEVAGGRIQDIGVGLVLEGRYAANADVIDLGSGDLKRLDLSHELVVLDWVYEPTLEHAARLVRDAAAGRRDGELERFAFQIALRALERVGFTPLTRPILLRIGFRDICRDLDLHEGTSVRLQLGPRRVVRVHIDYEANALHLRTPTAHADPTLEEGLAEAFPGTDLRRMVPPSLAQAGGYQVRLPLATSLEELREQIGALRTGMTRLIARFEPARIRDLDPVVSTFGERDTLARIREGGDPVQTLRVRRRTSAVASTVH
ncbi:MAG: hypothetical protein RQ745_03215 [Longimicrobiales bacterium]|nr:hypothetical protein [Longimicrobiales bacterium]